MKIKKKVLILIILILTVLGVIIGVGKLAKSNTKIAKALGIKKYAEVAEEISPESISLGEGNALVKLGTELQLNAKILPENVNINNCLTWESSDNQVAEVDQNGVVTGKTIGSVIITATTDNGISTTKTVVVGPNNDYIDIKNRPLKTFAKGINPIVNFNDKNISLKAYVMQNFLINENNDNERGHIYLTQSTKVGTFLTRFDYNYTGNDEPKVEVEKYSNNEYMLLKDFDKGEYIDSEIDEENQFKIWMQSNNDIVGYKENEDGTTTEIKDTKGISRIDDKSDNTSKNSNPSYNYNSEENWITGEDKNNFAIYEDKNGNQENDLIVIEKSISNAREYLVYNLNDWKSWNTETGENPPKLISTITHDVRVTDKILSIDSTENLDISKISVEAQGFDIDGSYIYIMESLTTKDATAANKISTFQKDFGKSNVLSETTYYGDTYISVYDLAGNPIFYRRNMEEGMYSEIEKDEKKSLEDLDFYSEFLKTEQTIDLNLDTDGDGKINVNVDLNEDGIADTNVNVYEDGIVDLDVNGNRMIGIEFSLDGDDRIDIQLDLFEDAKRVNLDIDGDGILDVDLDGDGIVRVDLDGDDIIDANLEIDEDGYGYLDLDKDGNGILDVSADIDGDGIVNEDIYIRYQGQGIKVYDGQLYIGYSLAKSEGDKNENILYLAEKEVVGIEIKNNPEIMEYTIGESLDTTGMTLLVEYEYGENQEITEGFTCTPTNLNTAGKQEITVEYEGKTAKFEVEVKKKTVDLSVIINNLKNEIYQYTGEEQWITIPAKETWPEGLKDIKLTATKGIGGDEILPIEAGKYLIKIEFLMEESYAERPVRYYELEIFEIPRDISGRYGQKLENIELPNGFVWKNKEEILNLEDTMYTAIYTSSQIQNNDEYVSKEVEIPVNVLSNTIIWLNEDGTELEKDENVPYGAMPSYDGETPAKEKDGYTYIFIGWTPEVVEVTGDATYTAKYTETVNIYSIEYDLVGGVLAEENPENYTVETESFTLKNPTKVGYTFVGWIGSNGEKLQKEITIEKGTTGDKQYTAVWTANADVNYKVKYLEKGTNAELAPQEIRTGKTFNEEYPEIAKAITGYTVETENQTIKLDAYNKEIVFYYTVNQYTAIFVLNNGEANIVKTQDYGTELKAPEGITKEGHTFVSWDKEVTGTMPAENVTYTAQWKVNQYTITYKVDGEVYGDVETYDYGTEITIRPEPTKEGYTFSGWDKELPETMPSGDIEVTGTFTINTYTVIWLDEDGTELEKDENVPYGTMPSYDGETPEKEEDIQYVYVFIGWEPVATKVVENTIYRAKYEKIEKPTGVEGREGQKLEEIELPEGFEWKYPDTILEEPEEGETANYPVIYKPEDSDNYNEVEIEVSVTIYKNIVDMSKVVFEDKTVTYNGEKQSIEIQGDLPAGIKAVIYEGNGQENVGEYTITVKFEVEETYASVEDMTAKLIIEKANPELPIIGELKATYGDELSKVKLPEGYSWEAEEGRLVGNAGENEFIVKYTPTDPNYKEVTGIPVTVIVEKANPTFEELTGVEGKEGKEGQKLEEIELPEGFEWKYPDTILEEPEEGETANYPVIYKPEDSDNYNEVEIEVSVTIYKNIVDMSKVVFEDKTVTYNGEKQSIEIQGDLPAGIKAVIYEGNGQENVGEYTITVKFEVEETYAPVEDMTAKLIIEKANPELPIIGELKATYGDELSKVELPEGYSWEVEEGTLVGNAGENEFTVKYTPIDTNYKEVTGIPVTVIVEKANPTFEELTGVEGKEGQKLEEIELPEGFEWKYPDTILEEPEEGETANYPVIYKPEDSDNYNEVELEVIINVKAIELLEIQIKSNPNKTEYIVGENLELEGLNVIAKYSDESEIDITDKFINYTEVLNKVEEKTITLEFEGKTASFTINVIEKLEVNIDSEENKELIVENKKYIKVQPESTIEEVLKDIKTTPGATIKVFEGEEEITDYTQKVETKMKKEITLGNQKTTYISILMGDVNGDGKVDLQDMIKINNYRLFGTPMNSEWIYEIAADVNEDDKKDLQDIIKINVFRLFGTRF